MQCLVYKVSSILCVCIGSIGLAVGQSYPVKPIRFIVPHSVAGAPDILARLLALKLSDALGQQIIVDNQPGAGGVIGAEMGARSAPDGYTIVVGSSALVINPSLYRKVAYNPERDFQPITALATAPLILVVHPSLPARTVRELIALAKAKPGQINYASGGSGSAAHMAAELFKSMAMVDLVHIPYKGTAPALIGLIGGHVSVAFYTMSAVGGHIKSGKLRALAISATQRSAAAPDLPTISESGVPGYEASTWIGVVVPTGTPSGIVHRLYTEIVMVLHMPDVKERFAGQGFDIIGNTPEQFSNQIKADVPKWAKVIKDSGAKVD